jgi:minor extracellular serine protease Vpr
VVSATAVLLATGGKSAGQPPAPAMSASAWQGLVGSRPRVAPSRRVIVVLKTPSLAQRVAAAGGVVGTERERAWTSSVLTAQKLLVTRLAFSGISIHPDYSFARVLDGFSAVIDPSAIPLIERDEDVAGVYPVRIAYPATTSTQVLSRPEYGPGSGHRPEIGISGVDGRGVTIALLDTGVDPAVPYLRGRVLPGIDVIGGDAGALAATRPDNSSQLERHGTEMAGLLVGAGGPSGLSGVATGAAVLPVRVAGWQPDAHGHWAIYARSDQIIAGLDRAVDPNDDGDAHDAARIALVPLAEPFAGFTDGPEARAAAGALALDTLVVAPAGNDGAAAAGYGDIAGPGGAPDALTVGALDARTQAGEARIIVRAGLDTLLDGMTAVAGAVAPTSRLDLQLAVPRGTLAGAHGAAPHLIDFFTRRGGSIVAGKAALVPTGASPALAAERAATAGAAAILLYGGRAALPAGGLGLQETVPVPVISLPLETAQALLARRAAGSHVIVTLGPARAAPIAEQGRVASFSSSGLAFDGRVKPELVAPGVGLATSDPGANEDGSPRFVTVNGSSAAAATVAGAAALLAQARPSLGADALKGLLVGTARQIQLDPVAVQGSGNVDLGAAVAGELAASPATLAFGRSSGAGWGVHASFTVTNLSTRTVHVSLGVRTQDEGAAAVDFSLHPTSAHLRPGHSILVRIGALTASAPSGASPADGSIVASVTGGGEIRVPWAIAFGPDSVDLIARATLSAKTFTASDVTPALLSLDVGRVMRVLGQTEIRPLALLNVDLWRSDGTRVGLLLQLRDVLPGRYTFGLTGRGPDGRPLPPGGYVVKIIGYPVEGRPLSLRRLPFTLK